MLFSIVFIPIYTSTNSDKFAFNHLCQTALVFLCFVLDNLTLWLDKIISQVVFEKFPLWLMMFSAFFIFISLLNVSFEEIPVHFHCPFNVSLFVLFVLWYFLIRLQELHLYNHSVRYIVDTNILYICCVTF